MFGLHLRHRLACIVSEHGLLQGLVIGGATAGGGVWEWSSFAPDLTPHNCRYSYAKRTHDLQAFQTLDEAFAWMDLLPATPLPEAGAPSTTTPPDDDAPRDSASNSTSASGHDGP